MMHSLQQISNAKSVSIRCQNIHSVFAQTHDKIPPIFSALYHAHSLPSTFACAAFRSLLFHEKLVLIFVAFLLKPRQKTAYAKIRDYKKVATKSETCCVLNDAVNVVMNAIFVDFHNQTVLLQ